MKFCDWSLAGRCRSLRLVLARVLCPGSVLSSYSEGSSLVTPYLSAVVFSALSSPRLLGSNGSNEEGMKPLTVGARHLYSFIFSSQVSATLMKKFNVFAWY